MDDVAVNLLTLGRGAWFDGDPNLQNVYKNINLKINVDFIRRKNNFVKEIA